MFRFTKRVLVERSIREPEFVFNVKDWLIYCGNFGLEYEAGNGVKASRGSHDRSCECRTEILEQTGLKNAAVTNIVMNDPPDRRVDSCKSFC